MTQTNPLIEMAESLRALRKKISEPPDQYRFTDITGRSTIVKSTDRLIVSYPGGPERDLSDAFKNCVIRSVFPAGTTLSDLCYCEADQGFYMWTGTEWYLFGRRA